MYSFYQGFNVVEKGKTGTSAKDYSNCFDSLIRLLMLSTWSRTASQASKIRSFTKMAELKNDAFFVPRLGYTKVSAAAVAPTPHESTPNNFPSKSVVNLDKMFFSKPCSLALAPDSPLRVEDPKYEGVRRILLKLVLFYSKQSKSIRGANVVYRRIVSQVDKPAIYDVFNLEKNFKMTFSLLVLHMWLCLRRLKQEGKEGVEFGQYLYELYNHDLEMRVSKAGVNLLLIKWMKELEKIFYGNIIAYDTALLAQAKPNDLVKAIWKNVYSDGGVSEPDATAMQSVQAMARYVRRELACLSLTETAALYSGNFMFTSLAHASA